MVKASARRLTKTRLQGVDLEYEDLGDGEPVLFVHGSIVGDALSPLLSQPSLDGYRLINYHRRGFAGSTHSDDAVSIRQQADDALGLLHVLEIERAHVVGHSYGAVIALQLALQAPERVHSLALLEPGTLSSADAAAFKAQAQFVFDLYESGDRPGAIDAFCQAVAGPDYRAFIDDLLSEDWFDLAVADADTFFKVEMPALLDWDLTPDSARRIFQPALSVLGEDSAAIDPSVAVAHERLLAWLPRSESFVLPAATHALQLMNPTGMAAGLSEFFRRHPIAEGA